MDYEGEKFLLKIYRELYNKESVKHSGTLSDNKYELINKYLKRLEKIEQAYNSGERGIRQYIKNRYYDKYVMKDIDIPEDKNKKLVIESQKKSLSKWIDYLFETDKYPMWAKYWAFQGMLKLGQYDKDNKCFTVRSKKTLSPFVDIDIESLNKTLKNITEYKNKIIPKDKELEQLIENGNFGNIYAYNINMKINAQNKTNQNDGQWIEYRYKEGKKLAKALENKGTFWCITSEVMASNYLEYGTIYIYFTKDEDKKYTIPRICIRAEDLDVKEVKGVADTNDNLEYSMIEIAKNKLKDFYGSDYFIQTADDIKKLTKIYDKYQNNVELTTGELRFLYEIDREIGSFTWNKDSRIKKILKTRDTKQDLSKIFSCSTDKIGTTLKDLQREDLYIYYGHIRYDEKENYIIPPVVIGDINTVDSKTIKGFDKLYLICGSFHGENLETVENLNNLEIVTKNLYLNNVKRAKGLEKLSYVGESVILDNIQTLKGLKSLERVKNLSLKKAKYAEGATNLKSVTGYLTIPNMVDLSGFENLELVKGNLCCYASSSTDCLPNLKVTGNYYFMHMINLHNIKKKILKR